MRIAFDVKGTIEGPQKKFVLALFKALRASGHECVVWSNSIMYAADAVKDNNLDCEYMDKFTFGDSEFKGGPMDLCIEDDTSQEWLGSKRFIWVHNLPESIEGIMSLAESISERNWIETKCKTNRWASKEL